MAIITDDTPCKRVFSDSFLLHAVIDLQSSREMVESQTDYFEKGLRRRATPYPSLQVDHGQALEEDLLAMQYSLVVWVVERRTAPPEGGP